MNYKGVVRTTVYQQSRNLGSTEQIPRKTQTIKSDLRRDRKCE